MRCLCYHIKTKHTLSTSASFSVETYFTGTYFTTARSQQGAVLHRTGDLKVLEQIYDREERIKAITQPGLPFRYIFHDENNFEYY